MSERNNAGTPLAICGVVTLIHGGFLYLKRRRGTSSGGCFNIPGGKIESGETPVQGAVREFGEETGIKIGEKELEKVGEFDSYAVTRENGKRDIWVYVFLLVRRDIMLDSISLIPSEHEGKKAFSLEELRELRNTQATRYIEANIADPEEVAFTPPDAKLLRDYFWVFEKGHAKGRM